MAKTQDSDNCIIGEGSVFEGRFYVEGSIRIDGKFQGDIRTGEVLTVSSTGKVKTDIKARKVTIAGTLIGNITASEEVNIIENGKVLGNIVTPKLNVEPGVITSGKLTITSSTQENVAEVITGAFGEETEDFFKTIESNPANKTEGQK